jgi:hypothetical protein
VNSTEPCARGRRPTWQSIGRTVLVSRPSILEAVAQDRAAHDFLLDILEQLQRERPFLVILEQGRRRCCLAASSRSLRSCLPRSR